jgi:hypothetical protein
MSVWGFCSENESGHDARLMFPELHIWTKNSCKVHRCCDEYEVMGKLVQNEAMERAGAAS